jgi:hypothetical protein
MGSSMIGPTPRSRRPSRTAACCPGSISRPWTLARRRQCTGQNGANKRRSLRVRRRFEPCDQHQGVMYAICAAVVVAPPLIRFWRELCGGRAMASPIREPRWREGHRCRRRPACVLDPFGQLDAVWSSRSILVNRRNVPVLWDVGRRPRAAEGFGSPSEWVDDEMADSQVERQKIRCCVTGPTPQTHPSTGFLGERVCGMIIWIGDAAVGAGCALAPGNVSNMTDKPRRTAKVLRSIDPIPVSSTFPQTYWRICSQVVPRNDGRLPP